MVICSEQVYESYHKPLSTSPWHFPGPYCNGDQKPSHGLATSCCSDNWWAPSAGSPHPVSDNTNHLVSVTKADCQWEKCLHLQAYHGSRWQPNCNLLNGSSLSQYCKQSTNLSLTILPKHQFSLREHISSLPYTTHRDKHTNLGVVFDWHCEYWEGPSRELLLCLLLQSKKKQSTVFKNAINSGTVEPSQFKYPATSNSVFEPYQGSIIGSKFLCSLQATSRLIR